jgi:hypothetical protein
MVSRHWQTCISFPGDCEILCEERPAFPLSFEDLAATKTPVLIWFLTPRLCAGKYELFGGIYEERQQPCVNQGALFL